ncbi:MAG: hypothetical protein WC205_08205 [Opitutaceae bacterium]|jgi:hypothetical protein
MKRHIKISQLLATVAFASVASLCSGTTLFSTAFDTTTDYDNNFVEILNGASVSWDGTNKVVSKTGVDTSGILFNDGGTAGTDSFSDVTASIDVSFNAFAANSIGIYQGATNSTGYLGLVNFLSSTSVQLRIFDSNSAPNAGTVGTTLTNVTLTPTASLTVNTFYTVSFSSISNGSNQDLTLSLSSVSGTVLATTLITDNTSAVQSGQIGLRPSSQVLTLDNFAITSSAIPEPATASMIMGAIMVGVAACVRRRRS